jgi:hypothetical protein
MPLIASLDCSNFNCSCWPRIRSSQRLPVTGLSLAQYAEVKAALAASAKADKPYTGILESRVSLVCCLGGFRCSCGAAECLVLSDLSMQQ